MKRMVLQIVATLLATGAFAVGTADLVSDEHANAVLDKKCIRLGTTELLPLQFETAIAVLSRPDLVAAAQVEFARSISDNGKVDSPVIEDAPGKYHYLDHKERRTDITELYRKQTDAHSFDYVMLAASERFMGGYDIIIHLQVIDAGDAGIIYCVKTHAYPRNWVTRVSARDIGVTKKHFRKKMKTISWVAREVTLGLCEAEEFRQMLAPIVDETSSP